MPDRDWNDHYAQADLPWDTGEVDANLCTELERRDLARGRALEVGCGTATNAIWLATHGFEVDAIDIAPKAIEMARAKLAATDGAPRVRLFELDFLTAPAPGGPYDLVFDRGCFHVFDDIERQSRFALSVAASLGPIGRWLSVMGSTEGGARESGPPRRSARDIAAAIEPALEIVELRSIALRPRDGKPMRGWLCWSRRREVPAHPSTGSAPATT